MITNKNADGIYACNNDVTEHCTESKSTNDVMVFLEKKVIPTYQPHEPNTLPMFIEKKAYQGATGRVYPIPYTDRLTNKPIDKIYETLNLENEYISVMVLPEIGGRIQIGRDKINGYDFIYNNTVIKPAMIGLAGPWISGGIEFNWPQHHRPTTFMPVCYAFEENADGSKTVWVGEVEPFNRTEGIAGITVCPGKSYIKVKVRLHNRTPYPQTFMWWANLAVSVNEQYKIVFPPDVEYVCDHDRRAVISFPIMKGKFYTARQFDYGEGTDGSWFPNIVVPTSLMVMNGQSEFNFISGYDFKKDAGIVHVANHHISPGKKLFTWGDGDFGKAWANNLTDKDGPYVELMTGVYTDNQPDFSWIQPYETKVFEQYWYPIRKIGVVKNATIDAAVSFEVENGNASIGFNTTGVFKQSTVILKYHEKVLYEQKIDISPKDPFTAKVKLPSEEIDEQGLEVLLVSNDEKILVSYKPVKRGEKKPPETRLPALPPKEIETTEELYINGLHLEQYRHHTYDPKEYYLEALKRDNEDIRCNNAMGMLEFRNGKFDAAERYFRKAMKRLISRNDNPYDTEVFYNLGLVLKMTGRYDEAYKYFYKAVWHYSWRSAGYYALAEISARKGDLETALNEINFSLATNTDSVKGRNLKTVILRKLGRTEEALEMAKETAKTDLIDIWSRYEIYTICKNTGKMDEAAKILEEIKVKVRNNAEYFIDVAIDYSNAGFYEDAINILSDADGKYPMVNYYMGYYYEQIGDAQKALEYYKLAEQKPSDYCFPNRLDSINVLKCAQNMNPAGAKAFYYLGNLYYDKFRYEEAIENWEKSRALDENFAIVHRNLGIAYFDKRGDAVAAKASMEKAFSLDRNNSRIFYELQQLYKNVNVPIKERLALYDEYSSVVEERDDCYLEKVILYTQVGKYDEAVEMLKNRKFNIYEGGEGKLTRHHGWLHVIMGLEKLAKGNMDEAIAQFKEALVYPANYGEGRSYMAQEAHIYYFTGLAYEKKGDFEKAKEYYLKASTKNIFITEVSYFEGLALRKLGKDNEACKVFFKIIEEGDRLIKNCDKYGYFGVGLPIPQPFEGDIRKLNTVAGALLKGIGYRGLGNDVEEKKAFGIVRELDPYNFKLHIFDNIVR